MKITQLNLLIPEQLPTQNELKESNKEKVLRSLNLALQSLDMDCQEQAILQINQALIILNPTDILTADFNPKDIKKNRSTLEYDNYFNVKHVQSKEPEICLVRSVLIAYQYFLLLCYETNKFDFDNIKIQQQGFRNYFQLLSRVFNLSLN